VASHGITNESGKALQTSTDAMSQLSPLLQRQPPTWRASIKQGTRAEYRYVVATPALRGAAVLAHEQVRQT